MTTPASCPTLPPALAWLCSRPFFQAGLQGYSDASMRILARRRGAPYCVTESLLDEALVRGGRAIEAAGLAAEDHPIAGQIIGTDPRTMARAARVLVDLGYDVIDVNLACPVKKVREICRGGHLLTRPELAVEILNAVSQEVSGDVPVTVKLRRGFDDSPLSLERFHQTLGGAMAAGCAAVTVHCRTVEQKYEGPSHWPFLAELTRAYPGVVILGSGDIFEAADIFRMLQATGVRGVSVARGAIGNPWIFRQAYAMAGGEAAVPPTVAEQGEALAEQYALAVEHLGEERAGRQMRKIAIKMSRLHPHAETVAMAFAAVTSTRQWHEALALHYAPAARHP